MARSPEAKLAKAARNRDYRKRRTERELEARREAARLADRLRMGVSEAEQENRETWLTWAVEILRPVFAERGYILPEKIRVALGWPKSAKALGECWDSEVSAGGYVEIFMSPKLAAPLDLFDTLVHELCHAAVGVRHGHKKPFADCAADMDLIGRPKAARGHENPAFMIWAEPLIVKLGAIPHDAMTAKAREEKKQTTRMVKKQCGDCGMVVRTAQQWIDKIEASGAMRCMDYNCEGAMQ